MFMGKKLYQTNPVPFFVRLVIQGKVVDGIYL